MDFLLAGTLISLFREFSMPGNCPASLRPTAARLWKTFRSTPNAIPAEGKTVRPPTGIAFTFDRIPQFQ